MATDKILNKILNKYNEIMIKMIKKYIYYNLF